MSLISGEYPKLYIYLFFRFFMLECLLVDGAYAAGSIVADEVSTYLCIKKRGVNSEGNSGLRKMIQKGVEQGSCYLECERCFKFWNTWRPRFFGR